MDLYSRLVAILKILFPVAALAILATLFLLSRSDDPTATIPFAEKDMADRMRDQQVTGPFFSGTTPKGEEIMVSASLARPGGMGKPAEAVNLDARITLTDGQTITLTSDIGSIDVADDMATFSGDVRISTATGYVIRTETLNTALNAVVATTPGTVTGTGPFGEFTAGRMQMEAKNEGGPIHMLFIDGVKLIYDPKQTDR